MIVRVLVCGSPDRGDDAAALRAIELLDDLLTADERAATEVVVVGGLALEHLAEADGPVVVADTAVGLRPGEVRTLGFEALGTDARSPAPRSSHELPIPEVVGLAELLRGGALPGGVVVIGGADFTFGAPLSPSVEAGLTRFARALADTVAGCLVAGAARSGSSCASCIPAA